jgi:hypothetical protein
LGLTTENAAHRVAVEWDGPEGLRRGVYIPRRDTSSRLTAMVGGRLFPGEHQRARFRVREGDGHYRVAFASLDGTAHVDVAASTVTDLPSDSVFACIEEASAFFQQGSLGYSATRRSCRCDAIELCCSAWRIEPLVAEHVESSFFDNQVLFPSGTVQLDSALVMRDIAATWSARMELTSQDPGAAWEVPSKSTPS